MNNNIIIHSTIIFKYYNYILFIIVVYLLNSISNYNLFLSNINIPYFQLGNEPQAIL